MAAILLHLTHQARSPSIGAGAGVPPKAAHHPCGRDPETYLGTVDQTSTHEATWGSAQVLSSRRGGTREPDERKRCLDVCTNRLHPPHLSPHLTSFRLTRLTPGCSINVPPGRRRTDAPSSSPLSDPPPAPPHDPRPTGSAPRPRDSDSFSSLTRNRHAQKIVRLRKSSASGTAPAPGGAPVRSVRRTPPSVHGLAQDGTRVHTSRLHALSLDGVVYHSVTRTGRVYHWLSLNDMALHALRR